MTGGYIFDRLTQLGDPEQRQGRYGRLKQAYLGVRDRISTRSLPVLTTNFNGSRPRQYFELSFSHMVPADLAPYLSHHASKQVQQELEGQLRSSAKEQCKVRCVPPRPDGAR
jgi:hypothetical protein